MLYKVTINAELGNVDPLPLVETGSCDRSFAVSHPLAPCSVGARASLRPSYRGPCHLPRLCRSLCAAPPAARVPAPGIALRLRSCSVQKPGSSIHPSPGAWHAGEEGVEMEGTGASLHALIPRPICVVQAKRHEARSMPAGKQKLQSARVSPLRTPAHWQPRPNPERGWGKKQEGGTCRQVPATAALPLRPHPCPRPRRPCRACLFPPYLVWRFKSSPTHPTPNVHNSFLPCALPQGCLGFSFVSRP